MKNKILELLKDNPGQLARDLADQISTDKKNINGLLYGKLNGLVRQDNSYKWYLVDDDTQHDVSEKQIQNSDANLAKLCRYYLACMGQDDTGVSTFAQSNFGEPDYSEISILPQSTEELLADDGCQRLLGKLRTDRSRLIMYLGYPTNLKLIKSRRSNWQGYVVEPLLLFPVEFDLNTGRPKLDTSYPIINQKPLQTFTNAERESLMDELVQLEDELGIGGDSEHVEIDELAMRLQSVRREWPWKDSIESQTDSTNETPLSSLNAEGIYNRSIVILAEKSPFTKGLESELKQLERLNSDLIKGTALSSWVSGKIPADDTKKSTKDLIEVLPMNLEQRESVNSAFYKKLSIITGPPGTGKSQVVTNLLINAAWQGKRVLFASKNNKAVDVVEARINNLGPRPILLRVGSNAYQAKLAEYLMAMLSSTATEDDDMQFEEANSIHARLIKKIRDLNVLEEKLIQARNSTDQLDQKIESIRGDITKKLFLSFKKIDIESLKDELHSSRLLIDKANIDKNSILVRLLWFLHKKSKFSEVNENIISATKFSNKVGIKSSRKEFNESNINGWYKFLDKVEFAIGEAESVKQYFDALDILQSHKSLEEISLNRVGVLKEVASNSESLWKLWLRLQPSKLTSSDRDTLNRYKSLLKMVIETEPGAQLGRQVYREYTSIFSKVSHLLPCWAVTSLSAKGKLPFEPGYFDLVVFDEASQCDIASALPLLYRAKAAVVIGDPKQLSHISGLQKGQDQQLLEKYNLVKDYPHWAYSYNSLFDLASGMISNNGIVNLLDHHRSHSDIIEFSNQEFYEDRLRVATKYDNLNLVGSKEPGVRWVDSKGEAYKPSGGGALNKKEVVAVVGELSKLVIDRRYKGSIGVVSPFRAQANAIRVAVEANQELSAALIGKFFLVDTVHKFQGDERDVMIFSPVLSKGMSIGGISFLKNNGNLFNVAITRARSQLIVVGDLSECVASEVDYLSRFAVYTQEIEKHKPDPSLTNVSLEFGSKYPEVDNPEQVSDWERHFYQELYKAGIKTLPQYRIEKYALDLAIVDGERFLDIEVDGEKYHRNWTGELCRRDQIRNQRLYELGWDVLRFWVYEIRDDMPSCVKKVKKWVDSKE